MRLLYVKPYSAFCSHSWFVIIFVCSFQFFSSSKSKFRSTGIGMLPRIYQPFVSQHKAHTGELVNYFLIDVAQVYRVYMIWELALTAEMCMKRI